MVALLVMITILQKKVNAYELMRKADKIVKEALSDKCVRGVLDEAKN